jgi:hypothetical protein
MNFLTASKTKFLALCVLGLAGFTADKAQATSIFTFSTASSSNTSQSWTVNGLTLTTSGYYDPNAPSGVTSPNTNPTGNRPVDLYYNSTGDGSAKDGKLPGLGLNSNLISVNHVIPNNGFIQLHFSAPITSLNLDMVGVTDNWFVYGSNTAGQLGTVLYNTTVYGTNGSFNIPIGHLLRCDLVPGLRVADLVGYCYGRA